MASKKQLPPQYCGQDKELAIKAAKARGGMCVYSKPPENHPDHKAGLFGYWADDDGMIRSWETEIPLGKKR